jgi:organic hydroperoxide reductase OsmC/OhrA
MSGDKKHSYNVHITWTGNRGQGTSGYTVYDRAHDIAAPGKPVIPGSSDPAFRGDRSRYSPEDLLVASLSACHMLWYLHLCADAKIIVTDYVDEASGSMVETADGGGHFTEVVLRPTAVIEAGADPTVAAALHERAHALCFIASSVNFDVRCEPVTRIADRHAAS